MRGHQSFANPIVVLATGARPGFVHWDRTDVAPVINLEALTILSFKNSQDLNERLLVIAPDPNLDLHVPQSLVLAKRSAAKVFHQRQNLAISGHDRERLFGSLGNG